MNQQIVTVDGRRFLVETIDHQVVTELLDNERGAEVTGTTAAEVIALAEQIQANRHIPEWPSSDLSQVLAVGFELATEMHDDLVPAVMAYAVHTLATDPELAEWLDRMQTEGRAA